MHGIHMDLFTELSLILQQSPYRQVVLLSGHLGNTLGLNRETAITSLLTETRTQKLYVENPQ